MAASKKELHDGFSSSGMAFYGPVCHRVSIEGKDVCATSKAEAYALMDGRISNEQGGSLCAHGR